MKTLTKTIAFGLGLALAACGGGGGGGAGGHVDTAHAAHTAGGEVIRTAGTGQAVSQNAHQRFEAAAHAMHDHDDANDGHGDWTPATCNDVAGQFEQAANLQPGGALAEAWFDRGMVYERCGMTDRARESMQRAIDVSQNHNYCRATVQLGVYQYRAGQRAEAMNAFQAAIRADANCVEGYTNLAMMLRERNQGDCTHDQQCDALQAVANIRQALARDDKYIPALNQLALTYLTQAGDDPHSQRLMLAGIVCSQAVQVTQQHTAEMAADVRSFVADIYNTWGLIDIHSGQIIHALDHFRRAFTLNPNMFEAWVNYGTINLSFRGYDDAHEAFQHAVQLRDSSYDAHIGLGVALRGQDHPQDAEREYRRAIQLDANRPDAYFNLGLLYESYMGGDVADLQQAQGFLQQFQQKAGSSPQYAEALSRAQHHLRNLHDAIQALQAAAALNAAAPAGASGAPASGAPASPTPASGPPAAGGGASPAPAAAGSAAPAGSH